MHERRQRRNSLISTLLVIFALTPRPNVASPSSLPTRYSPCTALEYPNRSAGGFAPSAHMRTRTIYQKFISTIHVVSLPCDCNTSAGFPTTPANPPATPAHATVHAIDSFSRPVHCFARSATTLYRPKRAVEYVACRSIDADRPAQRDGMPGEEGGSACPCPVDGEELTVADGKAVQDVEHGVP